MSGMRWEWRIYWPGSITRCPDLVKARMSRAARDRWEIERLRSINADLLAALEALLSEVTDPWPAKDFESNVESARAAIAKAMGTKHAEI
jgi:hypothetical protein